MGQAVSVILRSCEQFLPSEIKLGHQFLPPLAIGKILNNA